MSTPEHYVIRREIARGGMGAILSATDQTLDREVAMKVMLEAGEQDPIARQRFLREALVLARLEHPNIVPIHEMGRDAQGRRFYTMKLVKGRTLQAIIAAIKKGDAATIQHYTLDRLLTIYRKVCDAIAFAHHHRIIHRDLKPENVMVGEFGEVLVMDWGLAKHLDDELHAKTEATQASAIEGFTELSDAELAAGESGLTMDGTVMGSPQYMPPEQAEGRLADIGTHSDIYSLGGVLYAILTLRPPVAGRKVAEVLDNVRSGNITPPTHHSASRAGKVKVTGGQVADASEAVGLPHCPDGKVPAALSAVTMRAMAFQPADRYANVLQIVADVEAYQGGFATSAEKADALTLALLFFRRHKALAAAAALVAMLIVGFLFKVNAEKRAAQEAAARATEAERVANATLADLRNTAPLFYSQAQVDFQDGKRATAFEKLGYAIQLDATAADYRLLRAHYFQSAFRLAEAAADYRRVLALRSEDASAKANLALCEKLLREAGDTPLTQDHKLQLLAALRSQKRTLEANLVAVAVAPDLNASRAAILARLRDARKLAGWKDTRLLALPDGTFRIDYDDLAPIDFTGLKDLPVSSFHFSGDVLTNLNCIAGLPLRELRILGCNVTDLAPLSGMPLEVLSITGGVRVRPPHVALADLGPLRSLKLRELAVSWTKVADLSPLAGMPLRKLDVSATSVTNLAPLARCRQLEDLSLRELDVTDLSPLARLPLTSLDCRKSQVVDIAALRTVPLRALLLSNTKITDLTPLAECLTLESLLLPTKPADLTPLRKLPKLTALSHREAKLNEHLTVPSLKAEDFWREYDAKQKPAQKQ